MGGWLVEMVVAGGCVWYCVCVVIRYVGFRTILYGVGDVWWMFDMCCGCWPLCVVKGVCSTVCV